jgi:hypothetical protein
MEQAAKLMEKHIVQLKIFGDFRWEDVFVRHCVWTKRHWGTPSISVSPANQHSTKFSIITRSWHNRPICGHSTEWTQLDSTPALYIYLFPFWLSLEHGAFMELPVSLQSPYLGQSVGLLGWVISSSQDLYTGQHKHRINLHIHINIHASSRIRTYDTGIQASQDRSCFVFFNSGLWGCLYCGHPWPIVPASGDSEDDCKEADGMYIDRGNRSFRRKPAPAPFLSITKSHMTRPGFEPGPPRWEAGD